MSRTRTTWASSGRDASAPPAAPGYGTHDKDHPAWSADPDAKAYETGGPSEFAEDVHQPPYPDSANPALPGSEEAGAEHPAHKKAALGTYLRRKASKCLFLADKRMGKQASQDQKNLLALDLMDMPDAELDAAVGRAGGDFLAMDDWDDAPMAMDDWDDAPMAMDDWDDAPMATEAPAAGFDDPMGSYFDSMDDDGDGFITADDWKGSRSLFASLDTDGDGILARHEVLAQFNTEATEDKEACGDDDMFAGLDEEERMMLASMLAEAKKGDEEEDDAADKEAGKKGDDDEDAEAEEDAKEDDSEEDAEADGDDKEGGKKAADPLGLSGDVTLTATEQEVHASLFGEEAYSSADAPMLDIDMGGTGGIILADDGQAPQPKKASNGVTSVGNQVRTASTGPSLESLWTAEPDVSDVFK